MNRNFARQIVQVLDQSGVSETSLSDGRAALDEKESQDGTSRYAIIRPMNILLTYVPATRWVDYDYEFIESGVISFPDLVRDYARATEGEWVPENLHETDVQRANGSYILLDFEFRGYAFHWELHWSGGQALNECERAIHQFARHYLTGDFLYAGGLLDQCTYLCYLPHGAIHAIHEIMQQVGQTWPTVDELVAWFQQEKKDRLHWEEQWATIIQHSDLLHVNDLSTTGARPLHTAVQEVLRGQLDEGVLPVLVGNYGAQPDLLDAAGKAAYDYATGNQHLIELLHTRFDGKIPVDREYAEQEWYLPIGIYI